MQSAVTEWEGKLEGIIEKYAGADAEVQQLAVDKIAEKLGAEAAAELRRRLAQAKAAPVVVEMPRIRRREKEILQRVVAEHFKQPEPEPEAEQEPEPEAEPEPDPEVAEPEPEDDYVEDNENASENVRRKLWRIESCLGVLKPTEEMRPKVWSVLRRMSKSNPYGSKALWVNWLKDAGVEDAEAWRLWEQGYGHVFVKVEELWEAAQREGWRFPVVQNLNRLDEMVQRVEDALVRVGASIYQSGGKLVRPVTVEVDATKGRKTRIARLVHVETPYLKPELSKYVDFISWNKEQPKGIAPHNDVVSALLGRYGKWAFSTLTGVICAPTLRRDGSILASAGFDAATGLLVLGPLPEMPKVSNSPSRADAERAIGVLDGLLGEFPFVDRASRSVALSGFLSTVCRAALSCVPMHATSAPAAGTGKSFLFDLVGGVAIGDAMPVIAAGPNLEEMAKRVDAQVIEGFTLLSIDNVSMPLGGDELCQAIERPAYKPRILGQSKMKERRNNWTLFATGNNLRLKDDVTRRSLLARLDAGMERPEMRKFRGNPFEEVLRNRGLYLWAALTVTKAYIAAGMPGRLLRIGDPFAEWSDLIRSALVWLGYDDPVLTMEAVRDNDPSRQARVAMFQAMANAYGVGLANKRTAAQMIADAESRTIGKPGLSLLQRKFSDESDNLKAAIIQYTSDRLDARHFGNKLNTDKNAIAGGLRLLSDYDSHTKVNQWYVEPLSEG
jgi:putative DNA primase/helicase